MKLAFAFAGALVALATTAASAESPKPRVVVVPPPAPPPAVPSKEIPGEKTARTFLTKIVESPDAVALPKAGIAWTFQIRDGLKPCDGMALTNGVANSAPLAAKLKGCIAAAYKAIGQGGAVAKIGLGLLDHDKFLGHLPKADQKKAKDLIAGTNVFEADLNGDGESLTISLAVHPANGVVAVWMEAEAVE